MTSILTELRYSSVLSQIHNSESLNLVNFSSCHYSDTHQVLYTFVTNTLLSISRQKTIDKNELRPFLLQDFSHSLRHFSHFGRKSNDTSTRCSIFRNSFGDKSYFMDPESSRVGLATRMNEIDIGDRSRARSIRLNFLWHHTTFSLACLRHR